MIFEIITHKPCRLKVDTKLHWCIDHKGKLIFKKNNERLWNRELAVFRKKTTFQNE